jgi:ATP-binding cassette subfamily B protein
VILLLINVKLTLLALGALPLVMGAAKRFSSRTYPVSVDLQQRLAELATTVEESITGIRAVKGLGIEGVQARRVQQRSQTVYTTSMAATRIRSVFLPVLDFLPALALVAVLWYGGNEVAAGRLSVGQLVEFNYYVVTLIVPLRMIGVLVAQMERGVASAMRLEDIFSQNPQITDRPGAVALVDHRTQAGLGQIRFEHVRFGYEPTAPILDGFDLSVAPGEAVALVGPTASGKTTVARLIPRFYDVDAGRVLIDGTDVRQIKLTDLRGAVGIVFQDTFLFSDTIRANIAFADPLASSDQVEAAARLAGAHDFIMEQREGYDTEIGQGGFSLSGGQRQRLALARAILSDPRILILDDATSSVDPAKEHEIAGALAQVMAGRTTLIIAHRAATIALADRVVLLDGGRVAAEGTHRSLLRTSERYRAVVGVASPSSPGPSLEAV